MLQAFDKYNDLSPKLYEELENEINSFGKVVRFKFDISNPNPDPEKKNGAFIYPFLYKLQPATFDIVDPYEKGNRKIKKIGMVIGHSDESTENRPRYKFRKIEVHERDLGVASFDLSKIEDKEAVMYLLLHPKLSGGKFSDPQKKQVITRIDELGLSKKQRQERTDKLKALNVAQGMSDKELVNFADAMLWDSTEDIEVLRNKVESLAETQPKFFNDLVSGKQIEYQAAVKQAMTKKIIAFDPAEYKFMWCGNNQTITVLSPVGEANEVEKFAEFLQTGGGKANEVYKKIKSLLK